MKRRFWVPVIFVAVSLLGCGKEVDYKEIQVVNGLMYKLNDSDPYTGVIKEDPLLMSEIHEDSFTYKAILDVQSGATCTSEVKHGKYNGKKTCQLKGNKVADIEYKNGMLDGVRKLWSDKNGKTIGETHLKEGKKDGENIVFNPETGDKSLLENYEQGKLSGHQKKWGAYYPKDVEEIVGSSELLDDVTWDNGKKSGKTVEVIVVGKAESKKPGQDSVATAISLKEENWKNDLLDGDKKTYRVEAQYPNKKILIGSGEYREGKPVGVHTTYANEKITSEKKYDDQGNPLSGYERRYSGDKLLSEFLWVPAQSKKGLIFVRDGQEEAEYKTEKNGRQAVSIKWEKGWITSKQVVEYDDKNRYVSIESFARAVSQFTGEPEFDDLNELPVNQGLQSHGAKKKFEDGRLVSEDTYEHGELKKRKTYRYESSGATCETSYVVDMDRYYTSKSHPEGGGWVAEPEKCGSNAEQGVISSQKNGTENKADNTNGNPEGSQNNAQSKNMAAVDSIDNSLNQPAASEFSTVDAAEASGNVTLLGPSFDCAKAGTEIEKMICSDPYVGNLDGILSRDYKALFGAEYGFDEAGKKATRDEQKAWMAKRNACATKECVIDAYKSRIDEICEVPVASGVNDCQSWTSLGEPTR